jgi:hypothetical protein
MNVDGILIFVQRGDTSRVSKNRKSYSPVSCNIIVSASVIQLCHPLNTPIVFPAANHPLTWYLRPFPVPFTFLGGGHTYKYQQAARKPDRRAECNKMIELFKEI